MKMAQSDIDRIMMEYEKLRADAVRKRNEKTAEIFEKYPQIEEIEKSITECGLKRTGEIVKNPLKGEEILEKMEEEIKVLKNKRKEILKKCEIPEDYNEIVYSCSLCGDTGYIEDGSKCICLKKKITEYEYEKSNMGNLIKSQNFENFNFDFYGNEKNEKGFSPSDYIKVAHREALKLCDNFENNKNLLFYGGTGVGKTFLSCCIAKRCMDLGKDVRFMSASKIFMIYDDYKFGRGDEKQNKSIIDEVYSCDLLIIDDLGTEFLTAASLSFFYDLINERITDNKKMVINTNLSIDEMKNKYTQRFISRLFESFTTVKIEGEDIRKRLI